MKTADPPEALLALSGQIHLFSQNQSRPALGLARALDYSSMVSWLAAGSNSMISILLSAGGSVSTKV
jgi:hypothetical protein